MSCRPARSDGYQMPISLKPSESITSAHVASSLYIPTKTESQKDTLSALQLFRKLKFFMTAQFKFNPALEIVSNARSLLLADLPHDQHFGCLNVNHTLKEKIKAQLCSYSEALFVSSLHSQLPCFC